MDLMIRWSTTVPNRRITISVFMGTSVTDDRDKDNLGIYGSSGISYGGFSRGCYEAYLVTLTNICFFHCFLVNAGP